MLNAKLTSQAIEQVIHEEILHILDEREEWIPDIANDAIVIDSKE